MKLEDFRAERKLSYAALAALIGGGITAKMAERYCKGTLPRDGGVMLRIVEITAGKVTPNDWYYAAGQDGAGREPAPAAAE